MNDDVPYIGVPNLIKIVYTNRIVYFDKIILLNPITLYINIF